MFLSGVSFAFEFMLGRNDNKLFIDWLSQKKKGQGTLIEILALYRSNYSRILNPKLKSQPF